MLGIIVATHSNLARGLREAVEMIDGPQEHFDVVPFCEGEDITFLAERIRTIAAAYEGAVCCCDGYVRGHSVQCGIGGTLRI